MGKIFYPALFHAEETGYSVSVPDLSGCFSEGESMEDAYSNTVEAVGLYLSELEAEKQSFPKATDLKDFTKPDDDFVVMIEFDILDYKRKHNSKAVKKTLTIPSWLNTLAEEKHINFSSVLKEALCEQLNID